MSGGGLTPTVGTSSPVRDLGLIDLEAVHVRCFEAGPVSNSAIDIGDVAALSTNEMVVIVPHACFIERRRPNGLNTPDQSLVDEKAQCVVDRLARNGSNVGLGCLGHIIGGAVGLVSYGAQDCKSLGGDMEAVRPEHVGEVDVHELEIRQIWIKSKVGMV